MLMRGVAREDEPNRDPDYRLRQRGCPIRRNMLRDQ